jgi:hypothetical protein
VPALFLVARPFRVPAARGLGAPEGNGAGGFIDELGAGDAILVNLGGRVPVDGTVVAGHSFVDRSCITGESMPIEKMNGAAADADRGSARLRAARPADGDGRLLARLPSTRGVEESPGRLAALAIAG